MIEQEHRIGPHDAVKDKKLNESFPVNLSENLGKKNEK